MKDVNHHDEVFKGLTEYFSCFEDGFQSVISFLILRISNYSQSFTHAALGGVRDLGVIFKEAESILQVCVCFSTILLG